MISSVAPGLIMVLAAVFSAVLVLALLPVLRRHAMVSPNARSSHRQATPQGGGIAVIATTLAVAAGAGLMRADQPATPWLVFGATVLIAIVGAWDDLRSIEVAPRLLLQAFAVALMLASLPAELRIAPMLPWGIERALLLIGCLWFVNLTNFMDGIDLMTVAEFVPVSVGLAVIGWVGALPGHGTMAALAVGGALLGFAPFNRPVAQIFLGDVGSLPIGLLFAWLLVLLAGSGYLTAAILLPLYYLADATLTLLRRIKNHDPFWQAHRIHFYQRASDRGFSVPQIVVRVFAINIALAALAIGSVLHSGLLSAAAELVAGAALVGGLLWTFARGRP
jgi:UDP-N-acetylmuramyl pentapeptide phosphotransferase/UDP-N-acetylglucosamine-1-phosphate transferase